MAHQVESEIDALEYAHDRGWSDGLPVVPPTRDRIDRMLTAHGLEPGREIGQVPERKRTVTAELVAANAVMAGCTDALFPVVLAAVEAVLDPAYNIVGPSASTGGAAPLVIVHGPVVAELGFNAETAVLGAGNRSNLTLGRALNLVIRNGIGSVPGDLDRATVAHAGRIAYCLPEARCASWPTQGEERGVPADRSAVTVFAAEAPHSVADHVNDEPEGLIDSFDRVARTTNYAGAAIVFVICPEHRSVFGRTGWTRETIRSALFERTAATGREIHATGRHDGLGPDERITLTPDREGIWIVFAGGSAGGHSAIIPSWLGAGRGAGSRPVTRLVSLT